MRLGIVGLPQSGKTTLFNLLTGMQVPVGSMQSGVKVENGVAALDDERLLALSELTQPKKTTPVNFECADINGFQVGGSLPGALLDHMAKADAFIVTLRAFNDPSIPHPLETIDVNRDYASILSELLLNDLFRVEAMLSRLEEEKGKGAREQVEIEHERELAGRVKSTLEAECPLREIEFAEADRQVLTGLGLLTLKPVLPVTCINEGQVEPVWDGDVPVVALQTKLEMEIGQLSKADREAYRSEYGIESSGRHTVLQAAMTAMRRISFFTLNENETRAWALENGDSALEAAGTIHSDLARGFIRAEVIAWDELQQLGGLAEARAAGKLRVEGKQYPVKDGEVVYIRFHV
jgi:ribosome-binding ATPase YchF (GTP1/OBG family)